MFNIKAPVRTARQQLHFRRVLKENHHRAAADLLSLPPSGQRGSCLRVQPCWIKLDPDEQRLGLSAAVPAAGTGDLSRRGVQNKQTCDDFLTAGLQRHHQQLATLVPHVVFGDKSRREGGHWRGEAWAGGSAGGLV